MSKKIQKFLILPISVLIASLFFVNFTSQNVYAAEDCLNFSIKRSDSDNVVKMPQICAKNLDNGNFTSYYVKGTSQNPRNGRDTYKATGTKFSIEDNGDKWNPQRGFYSDFLDLHFTPIVPDREEGKAIGIKIAYDPPFWGQDKPDAKMEIIPQVGDSWSSVKQQIINATISVIEGAKGADYEVVDDGGAFSSGDSGTSSSGNSDSTTSKYSNSSDLREFAEDCRTAFSKNPDIDKSVGSDYNKRSKIVHSSEKDDDWIDAWLEIGNDGSVQCVEIDGVRPDVPGIADITDQLAQTDSEDTPSATPEDYEKCYESGVASMGWIICPTIENTTQTADGILELLKDMLTINPDNTFSANISNVWGVFRNIANVVLIIIFLVVIFSQVTGYGIDNYGIKKILPRLIVLAILINLSYLICEIAVDLSNIIGNSLAQLMISMSSHSTSGVSLPAIGISSIVLGVLALIGTGVALGPAGVIGLLLAVLPSLASILLFFVVLSARMILVVLLTVVSPVTFALYVFPNTQSIFKKWWKVFETCLIIYPICGMLYGVAFLIQDIANADGGLFFSFIAIVAPFLPFLALPSLVNATMSGLGVIGSNILNANNAIKRAAGTGSNAVRRSDSFKNWQAKGRAGLNHAGTGLSRRGKILNKLGNTGLGRAVGAERVRARALGAYDKNRQESEDARAKFANLTAQNEINDPSNTAVMTDYDVDDQGSPKELFKAGTKEAYYAKRFMDAAKKGKTSDMNSMLTAMASAGMRSKDIAKVVRHAERSGALNNLGAEQKKAWLESTAQKNANGFMAKDLELSHWAQSGGADTLGDYGTYAKNGTNGFGVDDLDAAALGNLSGDSLAGLMSSGILSSSLAESALANNPNLSADKKIMLNAVADGIDFTGQTSSQIKEQVDQLEKQQSGDLAGVAVDQATYNNWTADYQTIAAQEQHEQQIAASVAIENNLQQLATTTSQAAHDQQQQVMLATFNQHQQNAHWNHQTGLYDAPVGFQADVNRPGIYVDNRGNEYNASDNTFKVNH